MQAGATIQQGSTGDDVRRAQRALDRAGFGPGAVDGIFGPKTDAAVRAFQTARGLTVDGIVGPQTWAALPAQACVARFDVPTNRSGCQIVPAGPGSQSGGESFDMEIDFDDTGEDCECPCGEYRQFVRGTITVNGTAVIPLLPVTGGPPTPLLPRPAPGAAADNFVEDGNLHVGNPHYGHRDDDPPGNGDPSDRYLPARADGCQYRGNDFPSVTGGPGTTFSIDVDFRGQAIDICNGGNVLNTNDWTVTCAGTL
jgi:hypothetical protein